MPRGRGREERPVSAVGHFGWVELSSLLFFDAGQVGGPCRHVIGQVSQKLAMGSTPNYHHSASLE